MHPNYDQETARLMKSLYPDEFFEAEKLPKPHKGKETIKAIVIGADPTYLQDNGKFDTVFGLENPDSKFFNIILDNLNEIGLSLNNIYVQNLIKSYFRLETSKNKIWSHSALLWLENLKREIDAQFGREIPIIATAEIILKTMVYREYTDGMTAEKIYKQKIVFSPEQNYFGRNLIALFRHHEYRLTKWQSYADHIKRYFLI